MGGEAVSAALNPHNLLQALRGPFGGFVYDQSGEKQWRCFYCGAEGGYEHLRSVACTFVYAPCAHCGQTPECAPDCAGIAAILRASGAEVEP